MLLVGLTGNYGMGKSTVLKMFQDLGAVIFDADAIVASLFREESVRRKIRNLLGNAIVRANGNPDKEKVAAIIFADETLRRSLEDILHPLVFNRLNELLKQTEKSKIVIVETPLLFEREHEGKFHRIITVETEQEIALTRLEKKGIRREDALQRLNSQIAVHEKMRKSDFVVHNNGMPEETEKQVRAIYEKLLHEASDGNHLRS